MRQRGGQERVTAAGHQHWPSLQKTPKGAWAVSATSVCLFSRCFVSDCYIPEARFLPYGLTELGHPPLSALTFLGFGLASSNKRTPGAIEENGCGLRVSGTGRSGSPRVCHLKFYWNLCLFCLRSCRLGLPRKQGQSASMSRVPAAAETCHQGVHVRSHCEAHLLC